MLSILKASAGSGKTFALTYEYIRMLLGEKDDKGKYHLNTRRSERHRSILAITFTNKATDEMKHRIVQELAVLAHIEPEADESPYLEDLMKTFGATAEQIEREAKRALTQLLFDFNFFNISTIDSFFQLVLRTFAYEAEIDGDYEVDLDTKQVIAEATDTLFSSLTMQPDTADSKETAGWITEYLIDRLRNGKAVALFNRASSDFDDFVKIIEGLSDETFQAHREEMFQYFHSARLTEFRNLLNEIVGPKIGIAKAAARNALLSMSALPIPGKGKFDANMAKAFESLVTNDKLPAIGSKTIPSIARGDKAPFNKDGQAAFAGGQRAEQYNLIIDACKAIAEANNWTAISNAISSNLFALGLFRSVHRQIEKQRAATGSLLLSDTNALLRKIIGDDDAPFIFERVGVNLQHFLIDEFQDTSVLQWENMRPLLNESQGYGHDNLIIGDEKQCIYRFRGSEPGLLQTTVATDAIPPVDIRGTTPEENTNWRSTPAVVEANNSIFQAVGAIYGYKDIYAGVVQQIAKKNAKRRGYVCLKRWDDIPEKDYIANALERMVDEMLRQVKSGYRGSDIAVLVRSRADGARVIETLINAFTYDVRFKPYGLHVISDDTLAIETAPAVRRIVSVLRSLVAAQCVDIPGDSVNPNAYYRTRAELINLTNHYEHNLGRGLEPSEALAEAMAHSDEKLPPPIDYTSIRCINLPSLVQRIVAHYFPGGTVPENQLMYVMAFEDVVSNFCATSTTTDIQSFLRWWDTAGHTTMLASTADANAVRVMTIHKSKGLEFRCVHIPLLYKELVQFREPEWFDPKVLPELQSDVTPPLLPIVPASWMKSTPLGAQYEAMRRESLLDAVNVLYVAFSRAVNELIVSYLHSLPKKPKEEQNEKILNTPSSGQLLKRALDSLGLTDQTAEWGHPTTREKDEEEKPHIMDPHATLNLPGYAVNERDEIWNSTRIKTRSDELMGARRGTVLHDLLANIATRRDIPNAVNRAIHCGTIKPHRRQALIEAINEAIDLTPGADEWFAEDARFICERDIQFPNGVDFERPDRVIIDRDGIVTIIDYKFGREHTDDHTEQVRGYLSLLRAMGYDRLRGYLWYVAEHRTLPVGQEMEGRRNEK